MATESDVAADNIEKLYKNFGILADAKDNISEVSCNSLWRWFSCNILCSAITTSFRPQHEKEYLEILSAVKGTPKEKRLASQFIARFFKCFPDLADQAIEAQLDLCEDDDVSVSVYTISYGY